MNIPREGRGEGRRERGERGKRKERGEMGRRREYGKERERDKRQKIMISLIKHSHS